MLSFFIFSPPFSEQAAVGIDLLHCHVGNDDQNTSDGILQQTGGATVAIVVILHQGFVHIYVDGGGSLRQRAGIARYMIEQAEIAGENVAHIQNEHDGKNGAQQGKGDALDLLSDGGAVDYRAFIHALIKAGDTGHINNHGIAEGLPGIQEDQNIRPGLGILIPLDGGAAGVENHVVDQAAIGGQEGIHEIADNNPGKEMGQEGGRLAYFPQLAGIHIADGNGQSNREGDTNQQEDDIIGKRIADIIPDLGVEEQEFKVTEAYPFAFHKQIIEESLFGIAAPGFESKHNTEHRHIAESQIPDYRRQ